LEPNELSAEEIIEAWIGKTIVVIDGDENQVIEEKLDQNGLHLYRNVIRHKSVTGTLVFQDEYDKTRKSRYLQCWYMQNPYSNVSINPTIFPTESRFVVVKKDNKTFEMKWVK
jgi:hypothetical protein